MPKPLLKILFWLIHHANRNTKSENFYAIKSKILQKYGKNAGYDVQYFKGIKCNSCSGRGAHPKYSWTTGKIYDWADCYHCWGGWYRPAKYVLLERFQLGKYIFHQPKSTHYSNDKIEVPITCRIEGFVEHKHSKYGDNALTILYILFDFKRWARMKIACCGNSYHYRWNTPYKIISNIIWISRHGRNYYPLRKYFKSPKTKMVFNYNESTDDLPF